MSTAFLEAVKKGETERVQSLLNRDPALRDTLDEKGISAVLLAAYHGHMDLSKSLASQKAGLSIFEASTVGNLERVAELIRQDPTLINAYSVDGFTPLHLAAFFGNTEVAGHLLANKAQVNAVARNPLKVMPLHSAIARNEFPLIQLLVDHGADVNASQQSGFTPLHGVAQNGNLQAAILLLSRGANVNPKTETGKTPLALTTMEGPEAGSREDREKVADFLREHGAA